MRSRAIALALVLTAAGASAQSPPRRATNIAALAAFPTFYHGRQVIVVGQVSTDDNGRKRVTNMITEGYHRHLSGVYPPGLYLFANRHSLFEATDILEHHWLDGAGERRRLLD